MAGFCLCKSNDQYDFIGSDFSFVWEQPVMKTRRIFTPQWYVTTQFGLQFGQMHFSGQIGCVSFTNVYPKTERITIPHVCVIFMSFTNLSGIVSETTSLKSINRANLGKSNKSTQIDISPNWRAYSVAKAGTKLTKLRLTFVEPHLSECILIFI